MFKEIGLEAAYAVFDAEKENTEEPEFIPLRYISEHMRCISEEGTSTDEYEIKKILTEYINIQYAVSCLQKRRSQDEISFSGTLYKMGIINNVSEQNQLIAAKKIFEKVALWKSGNESVGIQVSRSSDTAMKVFDQMKSSGKLNKWVNLLTFDQGAQDVARYSGFEYIPDFDKENLKIRMLAGELAKDDFIVHMLQSRTIIMVKNMIEIPWSMEELDKNAFIQAFSLLVDKVYVAVMGDRDDNGKVTYYKMLTWK